MKVIREIQRFRRIVNIAVLSDTQLATICAFSELKISLAIDMDEWR